MSYVITDDVFLLHKDPLGQHPENPQRLRTVLKALSDKEYRDKLVFRQPTSVREVLLEIHARNYVEFIREESMKGFHYIDVDTYVNEHTFRAASMAVSASYEAAELSLRYRTHVLVLPRPPGHHAGRAGKALGALSNGFCIFNNAAAAVIYFKEKGFKVLVIDFDVHHGNGTQEIFWEDDEVLHIDMHEEGIYPGTGNITDVGGRGAEGTKINIPLHAGASDGHYAWVISRVIKPLIKAFAPDALVVSAGFDSHRDDPMAFINATERTFLLFGSLVHNLLNKGIVRAAVTVLEGGYGLSLMKGLTAYVDGVLGVNRAALPEYDERFPPGTESENFKVLEEILREYWGI